MIKNVIIQNFKSIKQANVDLSTINVLIGYNGAGKTNFISFFELLSKLYNQRLREYIREHDGANSLLYNGSKSSTSMKGLFNFNNVNAFFFNLKPTLSDSLFIESTGDYYNYRHDAAPNYNSWNCMKWDNNVEESQIVSNLKWRAEHVRNFLKSFTIYHFHDTSVTSAMRRPCIVEDNDMLRHDASNLPAFLYKLQLKFPQSFALIEAIVRSIAPYFKNFNLKPSELNPDKIYLRWEENDSDNYLDATSLSDGTLRFIALATLLLQPEPPQTIIIDEPELGLHPSAINKLSGLIKKVAAKGTQVIVATQSVSLVNFFDPEDILVSERFDGGSIYRRLNSDELNVWLEDYSIGTIWEKNIIGGLP